MPTLCVEKCREYPEDLYRAIRARARARRTSISAEVLAVLSENVPNPEELARWKSLIVCARKPRPPPSGPFSSAEEMLREDRARRPLTCRTPAWRPQG